MVSGPVKRVEEFYEVNKGLQMIYFDRKLWSNCRPGFWERLMTIDRFER